MKLAAPVCPKCGEPARFMHGLFVVRLGIRVTGDTAEYTEQHWIGGHVGPPFEELECGGGHTWDSRIWLDDDEGEVDE